MAVPSRRAAGRRGPPRRRDRQGVGAVALAGPSRTPSFAMGERSPAPHARPHQRASTGVPAQPEVGGALKTDASRSSATGWPQRDQPPASFGVVRRSSAPRAVSRARRIAQAARLALWVLTPIASTSCASQCLAMCAGSGHPMRRDEQAPIRSTLAGSSREAGGHARLGDARRECTWRPGATLLPSSAASQLRRLQAKQNA